MTTPKMLKIVIVGDGVVGKTCLLIAYTTGKFPEEYIPTVFDNYIQPIEVDGIPENMTLWDTAGQEDYERLRPLAYPNTNCFLICFSVDASSASYENVINKWVPEVRKFNYNVPVVLVATKADLRNDRSIRCYTTADSKKLKRKVKAQGVVECSAKNMEGLEEVFIEAVRACRKSKAKRQTRTCIIL